MRELLVSAAIPAPRFRYTPCVKSGPLYTVSGMVGLDFSTGALAQGGIAAETRQILANLKAALPDYGVGLEHMISARVYVVPFGQFGAFNEVWEAFFADVPPPARTSVGVSALPLGAQVEIEFTFYRAD
ncbi:RidA family protein [Zoogloea sp.]|uniref:RidA family protein n=1 Tax=Zoogloea sp. TaxID=49181 RepID=UPI001416C9E0|nr:MAG: RidA family protein [Zoogloea sp.]